MSGITSRQRVQLLAAYDALEALAKSMPRGSDVSDAWQHRSAILLIEARTLIESGNEGKKYDSELSPE